VLPQAEPKIGWKRNYLNDIISFYTKETRQDAERQQENLWFPEAKLSSALT
jgi:hypothetical protein